jgi:hypothetical protein
MEIGGNDRALIWRGTGGRHVGSRWHDRTLVLFCTDDRSRRHGPAQHGVGSDGPIEMGHDVRVAETDDAQWNDAAVCHAEDVR